MFKTRKSELPHEKVISIYIVYDINFWQFIVGKCFTLGNSLFWAVWSTANADPDKFQYSGDGIRSESRGSFFVSDGEKFVC